VLVRGPDPFEPPVIDHRYNSLEADFERFEHGFEFFREALGTSAFTRHGARELTAGRPVREIVLTGVGTAQHPVGTCRMGPPSDTRTVIDSTLRVHGVEGLMVADSSIFPDNVMNNTNLTCYAVGEVAADLVQGRRLPPLQPVSASAGTRTMGHAQEI
jgi:choline dehydrogenase-like flavoprotein